MEIVEYEAKYQPDFKRLNLEWLERYGLAEARDLEMLDDPEEEIIKGGGCIFLIKEDGNIIATAGLLKEHDDEFELVKMAVDPQHQGRGISKLLLDHCLQKARTLNAKKIILYSNSQLKTALNLYKKYGFEDVDATDSPFVTADVKMELILTPSAH